MMDKVAFFKAVGLRESTQKVPGTDIDITLRELSAGQRERLLKESEGKGAHFSAALTVTLSCPDFGDDDIDNLLSDVKPETLMALSSIVYELSGVDQGAKKQAKKS